MRTKLKRQLFDLRVFQQRDTTICLNKLSSSIHVSQFLLYASFISGGNNDLLCFSCNFDNVKCFSHAEQFVLKRRAFVKHNNVHKFILYQVVLSDSSRDWVTVLLKLRRQIDFLACTRVLVFQYRESLYAEPPVSDVMTPLRQLLQTKMHTF